MPGICGRFAAFNGMLAAQESVSRISPFERQFSGNVGARCSYGTEYRTSVSGERVAGPTPARHVAHDIFADPVFGHGGSHSA